MLLLFHLLLDLHARMVVDVFKGEIILCYRIVYFVLLLLCLATSRCAGVYVLLDFTVVQGVDVVSKEFLFGGTELNFVLVLILSDEFPLQVQEVSLKAARYELSIEIIEAVANSRVLVTHLVLILVIVRRLLLIVEADNLINDRFNKVLLGVEILLPKLVNKALGRENKSSE